MAAVVLADVAATVFGGGAFTTAMSSTAPSSAKPGGATYTLTPVRKRYCSEVPLVDVRCGTSSTKNMSQHSFRIRPGGRTRPSENASWNYGAVSVNTIGKL